MTHYAFMTPIKAGKADVWRGYIKEMTTTRDAERRASRRKMGLEHEEAWLQHTPNGDFAVVFMDCKDPKSVMRSMMTSNDPFDKWFREKVLMEVHGIDASNGEMPINEEVLH